MAPDLLVAELTNVLWKYRAALRPGQAASALEALPRVVPHLVPSLPPAQAAYAIAAELGHPAYDCFYLALAEQRGLPLATADRRLVRRLADTPWAARLRPLGAAA